MKTPKNTSFLAEKKNVSWQKPIKERMLLVYLDLEMEEGEKKPTIQPSLILRLWSS